MLEHENNQEEQLDLGFKEPFSNKLRDKKYRAKLFFVKLRTNSLLKNPAMWIFTLLSVSMLLIQHHYYTNYLDKLPSKIPLFDTPENLELRLVDSEYLFTVFLFCVFLFIISFALSIRMFPKFRSLSIMILGNLFIGIFLITVAYVKIFGVYVF